MRDVAHLRVRAGHDVRLQGTDASDVMTVSTRSARVHRDLSAGIDGTTGLESAVSGSDVVIDATMA